MDQSPLINSIQFDFSYNPLENPPDFEKAYIHQRATQVGKIPIKQKIIICPCCDNVINKKSFDLLTDADQFVSLGIGYSLFFILYKYFALIIVVTFIISGGAYYLSLTVNCKQNCFKFFGITILNNDLSIQSMIQRTQVYYVITSAMILVIVIIVKFLINKDVTRLQKKIICQSQYTIMIQNIPPRTTQTELKQWILQKFKFSPYLINFAFDCQNIIDSYTKKQQYAIKLNSLKIKQKQIIKNLKIDNNTESLQMDVQQIRKQIRQLQHFIQKQANLLQKSMHGQNQYKQVGTVFVTFDRAQKVQKILEVFQKTFLNIMLDYFTSPFFQRNQLLFKQRIVYVYRAPAPKEILWQNLQFSVMRNLLFQFLFIIAMALMMIIIFRVQYTFVSYSYTLRHQGQQTKNAIIIIQAVIMSGIILIMNALLRLFIKLIVMVKRLYSYTQQESSFCSYYSIMYILNACFTIYIVHGQAIQTSNSMLLYDIHLVMLVNAFSEPLFKIFDPTMWWKYLNRFRIKNISAQKNPYPQSYIQRLWQGHQISNADNYQYIIRVLFITIWFSGIAPLGVIFSLLGMLFDYWIIKFMLTKVYKMPNNLSKRICRSLNFLEMLPLIFIGGLFPFIYNLTLTVNLTNFLQQFLHYGVTSIVILLCILGYLFKFRPKSKFISQIPYERVELAFGFNYQTQNPLTKYSGNRHYIQSLMKNEREESRVISDILQLKGIDEEKQTQNIKNHKINTLKANMLRKISSSIDMENQFQLKPLKAMTSSIQKLKLNDEKDDFLN